METFTTSNELNNYLAEQRLNGVKIGFVPTMGALHSGHISLVRKALSENAVVVSSVFINPTQFNDQADFERYPRQLEEDSKKLSDAQCSVLFSPAKSLIYPVPDLHQYKLGDIASRLDGERRPGHFNGVASVVKRLLELVAPDRAYFGLKDYQQFLVIKSLVRNYGLQVEVVGCPTLRDADGLAMSSRNQLLSAHDRVIALQLFRALTAVRDAYKSGQYNGLESLGRAYLEGSPHLELEYFDLAHKESLEHLGDHLPDRYANAIALVAARVNGVRLIDNLALE